MEQIYGSRSSISLDSIWKSLEKWASLMAQMVNDLSAMQETGVQTLDREFPLAKGMQPTPVFLPGESYGQRSLTSYGP